MRAKSFLQVSLGILALALAYHLGAVNAQAQFGSMVSTFAAGGGAGQVHWVMTPNGDVYVRDAGTSAGSYTNPARFIGNFWDGATPAQRTSFGELKARYRDDREATPSPATGR